MKLTSSTSTSSRSHHPTRSTRRPRSIQSTSPPTSPTVAPVDPRLSYDVEFPDWLPENKKQDIINLQVMTLNSPRGRIRRPRKRKRDPNHIPRPMNSFLSYRTEQQEFIRKYCPGANHREISKIVAKWWHELDEEGKELYREQAISAKLEHAERYPDYKFTPKKRKSKADNPTFKMMDGKKVFNEEVHCSNIHDIKYDAHTGIPSYAYGNGASIDPAITSTAAAAASGEDFLSQFSYQDFLTMGYPYLDEKTLTLLSTYDLVSPMLSNEMVSPIVEDPTLYPNYLPKVKIEADTECTPMLDYSESPMDACLDSPSIAYPPSFPLNNAYGPNCENQGYLWHC